MPRLLGWYHMIRINTKWQMNYETEQMQNKKDKANRNK